MKTTSAPATLTCRLDNGMTVILRECHGAQVVAAQVWVGVGSSDEGDGEAGIAHVLEHMIFKGTARRGVGDITRDVERAGGGINAWTSLDETVFHVTLAAASADVGLDVLSDALLHPTLDGGELARELPVIAEEIRMGDDSPERVVSAGLFARMFADSPYGRPVTGSEQTIGRLKEEDVRAFHARWYTPANMVFIAVGDFSIDPFLERVKHWFGGVPGAPAPIRRGFPDQPAQRAMRVVTRAMPVAECSVAMGVKVPGFRHPDVPALDVLAALLGQGTSSRLETLVCRKLSFATEVNVVSYTPRDEGALAVYARVPVPRLQDFLAETAAQLCLITRQTPARPEVDKAIRLLISEDEYAGETVDGQARRIGYARLYTDDETFEEKYTAALRAVTPDDVREVASRYLQLSRLTVSAVVPQRDAGGIAKAALKAAVTAGWRRRDRRRSVFRGGDPLVVRLDSGDTVIVKPVVPAATVAARAAFLFGQRNEPAAYAGMVPLMSALLVRGAAGVGGEEIAQQMDNLACSVSGFSGRNTLGISGEFLKENWMDGLALMARCMTAPSFEPAETRREKQIFSRLISGDLKNARAEAFRRFQQELFGTHPYGRPIYGTIGSLTKVTPEVLRRYHRRAVSSPMVLAVVGAVDAEAAVDCAMRHFPSRGQRTALSQPRSWARPQGPLQVVRSMAREQSHLVIGFPGAMLNGVDRYAIDVLVEMLGGHGGRLFSSIREEQSLAYDVSGLSFDGLEPGFVAFYAGTSPGNERAVVDAILQDIRRIQQTPPAADELQRVIRYLTGSRTIANQRFSARAADMSLGYLYGLGPDAATVYVNEISRVTAARVVEVARTYLCSDHMVISCAGPGAGRLRFKW